LQRRFMSLCALALENYVAIPGKAISLKRFQYQVGRASLFARRIDVLNTKKPEPITSSGLQVAGDGGD
jgi:hypothetical protein